MNRTIRGTHQKALQINLDGTKYGAFAEIGAGQEVARWFFRVGGAAGTIAKTMSAYDMVVSDAIYGATERYVSRQRLDTMLEHEFTLLRERLDEKRGANTKFFVFADTVTARSYTRRDDAHGWMGIRFQTHPRVEPSQISIHVRMLDDENVQQQEALGAIGVNLIHAALYHYKEPEVIIVSLLDNLSARRVEVDAAQFTGPAFDHIDHRLMSLQLVAQGLTNAAMFKANGEILQPSDALYKRPILVERGTFSPITNVSIDMVESAERQFATEPGVQGEPFLTLTEMTLKNLSDGGTLDHQEFLHRADMLGALGKTILISNFGEHYRLAGFLFRHTRKQIGVVAGVPSLKEILEEKYYVDLEGGILEAFGRLFKNDLKLYVYPTLDPATGTLTTADNLQVAPRLRHLYGYLRENHCIRSLTHYNDRWLNVHPRDVAEQIRIGNPSWEELVPLPVARIIKERHLFGWPG